MAISKDPDKGIARIGKAGGERQAPSFKKLDPFLVNDIWIRSAEPAEIPIAVENALGVYNHVYVQQKAHLIPREEIQAWIQYYEAIAATSSLLVCATAEGEIIGSQCLHAMIEGQDLKLEELYCEKHPSEAGSQLFYCSLTFVDKGYLEKTGFDPDMTTKLFVELLKVTASHVSQFQQGVLLADIEKNVFQLLTRVLGMRWETLGAEEPWLDTGVVPAACNAQALRDWLARRS